MRTNSKSITTRFANSYSETLNKFSPSLLENLTNKAQKFDATIRELRAMVADYDTVYVSRNGDVATWIDESQLIAKVAVKKGKGAGKSVSLWQQVDTVSALATAKNDKATVQGWIDEVRAIGTDSAVKVARKARVTQSGITVKFVASTAPIDSLDTNCYATKAYDANNALIGYIVTPKKRANKVVSE